MFCEKREKNNFLFCGGVKANVGHLLYAAGLAGVLRALCALNSRSAPPNARLNNLNPNIIELVKENSIRFPENTEPIVSENNRGILAGVNSFGFQGTIAHTILSS